MRRREFVTLVGGAAAAWPLAAAAQQNVPVVAYLSIGSQQTATRYLTALRSRLAEAGFVDSRNVKVELRAAAGNYRRLQEMAAEAVRQQVAVIVAVDSNPVVRVAQAATTTIPIVFLSAGDPIKFGLAASLNRPGGNMTGVTSLSTELMGKQLDLLHKIAPQATFAFLIDSAVLFVEDQVGDALTAGQALGRPVIIIDVKDRDVEAAFATAVRNGVGAILVANQVRLASKATEIVRLAARHRLPAAYGGRFWCERGGLMSYAADLESLHKIVFDYVVRILRGAKPADLPVQQPTKFEFIINVKTAKALGLEVPPTLLAIADEVIE